MGIPILQGRAFADQDTSRDAGVVVIDRELARQYWPGENPVGKSIKLFTQDFSDPKSKPFEIIGVAGPVRAGGIDEEPQPRVYAAYESTAELHDELCGAHKYSACSFSRTMCRMRSTG